MEIHIEKLVYGGYGLGRHEGQVVLVPFSAPGDRLIVSPVKESRNYLSAVIDSVVEPSPFRRTPPCAYYGRCGGCQLQHLQYDSQLKAKRGFIEESLNRIGGIGLDEKIEVVAEEEFNYRLRTQLKCKADSQGLLLGYFEPESHRICDIVSCPILTPGLNQVLGELRELPLDQLAGVEVIDLVEGEEGQVAAHPMLPNYGSDNVLLIQNTFTFHTNPLTFLQANHHLLSHLLTLATANEHGRMALDLYCGIGFFTIPLAQCFDHVVAMEISPRSLQLAKLNAKTNHRSNIEFMAGKVEESAYRFQKRGEPVDFVLVDPPRAGLTRKVIATLSKLKPARMTYVSCNPTTLARDLKHILGIGYRIESTIAIDLFPQTFHIETIVKLVYA